MYICGYMTRAPKGMSILMVETCKEAKDRKMTLNQSVHHMADEFLNAV